MAATDYINLFGVKAYWRPYEGGAFQDEEDFGLIDELTTTFSEDSIKHTSRQCGSVGIADRTASSSIEITGTIVTPEISPNMIARAFKGKLTETPVPAGTATENQVTITTLGVEYDIGLKQLSNVEVWDTAGQTGVQYTEGTDYTIDYGMGKITGLSGGSITAGSDVFVTADNEAYNDWSVAGFTQSAATGKLRVVACAVEDGMDVEYVFEKVSLAMDGDYSAVSAEDFLTMTLGMSIGVDDTITDPNKSKTINIYGADTINPGA